MKKSTSGKKHSKIRIQNAVEKGAEVYIQPGVKSSIPQQQQELGLVAPPQVSVVSSLTMQQSSQASLPLPVAPPVAKDALGFAPIEDVTWFLNHLDHRIVGIPKEDGTCQLLCFCQEPVVSIDGAIVCRKNKCNFNIPGLQAMLFYINEILRPVLGLKDEPSELMAKNYLLWLFPFCLCKYPLALRIYKTKIQQSNSLYFFNARCTNKNCEQKVVKGPEIIHKMKVYLHDHPDYKASLLAQMNYNQTDM
ncbi:MAG TPA: hypothetical protein VEP90_28035 [Methylomirabilota bacterium]|nr:hypothetical protein [Methylomirabilota bacterium]